MKRSMYRFSVFVVLIAMMFLIIPGSVVSGQTDSDGECVICEQSPHNMQSIPTDDPRIINLKQSPQAILIEKNYGDLVWDEASLQLIEEKQWQILAIPIKNENNSEIQILMAATQDGKDFRVLVFGMIYEKPSSSKFNGTLKFYSPEGELGLSVTYKNGQLQDVEKGKAENSPKGLNWSCFLDCLGELGLEFLPVCTTFCTFCAGLPNPYNPGCWGCAACIGGTAITCIVGCWE